MTIAPALLKIADDLARIAREEEIDRSEIDLAYIRLRNQVEMVELGIDDAGASQ